MKFPFHARDARILTAQHEVSQEVIDKISAKIRIEAVKGLSTTTVTITSGVEKARVTRMLEDAGYKVTAATDTSIIIDWSPIHNTIIRQPQYQKDWVDPEGVGQYRG